MFVESKLRYGLDDFQSFVLQVSECLCQNPHPKLEAPLTHHLQSDQTPNSKFLTKFKRGLSRKFAHLDAYGVSTMQISEKMASLDSSKEEYLPIVFIPFI